MATKSVVSKALQGTALRRWAGRGSDTTLKGCSAKLTGARQLSTPVKSKGDMDESTLHDYRRHRRAESIWKTLDSSIGEVQGWLRQLEDTHGRQRRTFHEQADVLIPSRTSSKMSILFDTASFQNDQMAKRLLNMRGVLLNSQSKQSK